LQSKKNLSEHTQRAYKLDLDQLIEFWRSFESDIVGLRKIDLKLSENSAL
jgi:site-specific recombinase XerC